MQLDFTEKSITNINNMYELGAINNLHDHFEKK